MREYAQLWVDMRFSDRQRLRNSALSDDPIAKEKLFDIADSLKAEVNARVRELQKHGFNYIKRFKEIENWADTFGYKPRMLSAKELDYNIDDIFTQMEMSYDFLHDPTTIYRVAKRQEEQRFEAFMEHYAGEGDNWTLRSFRKFMRFLGSEETLAVIEAHGGSEMVIDMFYDIYNKSNNKKSSLAIMSRLITEFKAEGKQPYEFDDKLKESFGIDVDYYRAKYQTRKGADKGRS